MDGYEQARDEYQQIQQLRSSWSGFIMGWLGVMVPIGGALFGFFSYLGQTGKVPSLPWSWLLPILGWLIFVILMFTWRIVVHHIDRQIVGMYPRMIELEQRLGWSVNTIYYYNNLSRAGRQILQRFLPHLDDLPERRNYLLYRQACERRGIDPHGLLLNAWEEEGYQSVGSRGHTVQDFAVFFVSIAALVIACFLARSPENCLLILVLGSIFAVAVIIIVCFLVLPRGPWH